MGRMREQRRGEDGRRLWSASPASSCIRFCNFWYGREAESSQQRLKIHSRDWIFTAETEDTEDSQQRLKIHIRDWRYRRETEDMKFHWIFTAETEDSQQDWRCRRETEDMKFHWIFTADLLIFTDWRFETESSQQGLKIHHSAGVWSLGWLPQPPPLLIGNPLNAQRIIIDCSSSPLLLFNISYYVDERLDPRQEYLYWIHSK
jgi:hypothetical protein